MNAIQRAEPQENALLLRARDGSREAFEELVASHADRVFASLRSFGLDDADAQEVAQETFLRAWRSLARFEGRARFSTWLYRIAFNEAQRRLARGPRLLSAGSADERADEVADARPGPAARAQAKDLRAAIRRALGELPLDLRAAVVLRDIEGLSTREAASVLDVGEAAFKSRLHRGRTTLRTLLTPWLAAGEA